MESENKLFTMPAERQKLILQYIQTNGSCQITGLSEIFGVSRATIRRDLDEMDARGQLERTRGGALVNSEGTSFEHRLEEKMQLMPAEKLRIAKEAVKHILPGDTIFLDSGTTTYMLALQMSAIPNLTVITNDIVIAHMADLHCSSQMIVTGGTRRSDYSNVLVGSQTEQFLRNVRIDKAFIGVDAIDIEFGVSNSTFVEAEIKRQARRSATKSFLLADHSKFNTVALAKVFSLDELDTIICDKDGDKKFIDELKKHVHHVITV